MNFLLRSDHDTLKKDHDSFVVSAERENDLRLEILIYVLKINLLIHPRNNFFLTERMRSSLLKRDSRRITQLGSLT